MKQLPTASGPDMLDLVFSHRNRAYGAYQLRREYAANLGRALGLGLLIVATGLLLPEFLTAVSKAFPAPVDDPGIVFDRVPPPREIEKPPLPPAIAPPPAPPRQQFLPPVVRPDPQVPEAPPPHTVEELTDSKAAIGPDDQEGHEQAPPSTDPSDFGPLIEHPRPATPEKVYEGYDVQKMPGFPGGERGLLLYLAKNIRYPDLARETGIEGPVVLSFVVNADGSVSEVQVLRELGGGCTKEAIRVVQAMPRWSPGEANGNPVKVRFVLPVRFELL